MNDQNDDKTPLGLSQHQQDALEKAYQTLGEHFDNCVLLVHTEVGDVGGVTGTRMLFKGGFMTAKGLILWALEQLAKD